MTTHNIVILGGGFAAIGVAHYVLKHTIPALEASKSNSTAYKVTIVSPSTHFFYKIGAPRVLVSPDLIPLSKTFIQFEDAFKQYSADKYEIIYGSATRLDESNKSISVDKKDSSSTTVRYDTLVIASGSSSVSPLWSLHGSFESTKGAFEEMHAALPNASSVLISGGGAAGVETAGKAFSRILADDC